MGEFLFSSSGVKGQHVYGLVRRHDGKISLNKLISVVSQTVVVLEMSDYIHVELVLQIHVSGNLMFCEQLDKSEQGRTDVDKVNAYHVRNAIGNRVYMLAIWTNHRAFLYVDLEQCLRLDDSACAVH